MSFNNNVRSLCVCGTRVCGRRENWKYNGYKTANFGRTKEKQMSSPYELLGVPPTASLAQIRTAYRRRARELHPDKQSQQSSHDEFLRLHEAYLRLTSESVPPGGGQCMMSMIIWDAEFHRCPCCPVIIASLLSLIHRTLHP